MNHKLFTMLNKQDNSLQHLQTLGLTRDEATLYLELLKGPNTHLKLAHVTGINRTKVYRLADDLEKKSLVTTRQDDRGSFLVASDPATLEVGLITMEEKVKTQREAFKQVTPTLQAIMRNDISNLVVLTYTGEDGFKQMLWHELKANGENLIFGSGTIEALVGDRAWAEKHRAMTVSAAYTIRELLNDGEKEFPFTLNPEFMHRYSYRLVSKEVLPLANQIVIYNDTIATYHWRDNQKVGFEVISKTYATMMRSIFEHYWQLGKEGPAPIAAAAS